MEWMLRDGGVFGGRRFAYGTSTYFSGEGLQIEWFLHKPEGSVFEQRVDSRVFAVARADNNAERGIYFAQGVENICSVHIRHYQIKNDKCDGVSVLLKDLKRRFSCVSGKDSVSKFLQDSLCGAKDDVFVVN